MVACPLFPGYCHAHLKHQKGITSVVCFDGILKNQKIFIIIQAINHMFDFIVAIHTYLVVSSLGIVCGWPAVWLESLSCWK